MTHNEEEAKRWRISLRALLVGMTGLSVSLAIIAGHDESSYYSPIYYLIGSFGVGASIGGVCGRMIRPTEGATLAGSLIGGALLVVAYVDLLC